MTSPLFRLKWVTGLATLFLVSQGPPLPPQPSPAILPPRVFLVVPSPPSSHLCPGLAPAVCHLDSIQSERARGHVVKPGGRSPWKPHPPLYPMFVCFQLLAILGLQLLLAPYPFVLTFLSLPVPWLPMALIKL